MPRPSTHSHTWSLLADTKSRSAGTASGRPHLALRAKAEGSSHRLTGEADFLIINIEGEQETQP